MSGRVEPLGVVSYSLNASAECRQLVAGQETYVVELWKGLRRIAKGVQLLREAIPSRHHSLDVQRTTKLVVPLDSALSTHPDL